MTKHDKKDKKTEEIIEEIIDSKDTSAENELVIEEDTVEDVEKKEEEEVEFLENNLNNELLKLKEVFARQQADFDNFKKRVERDRADMTFFLKADILKKVLPRIDDLQRIIASTPEEQKEDPMYKWILSIEKKLIQDLEKMWVKHFESKWHKVDPDKHEVMTQIPWKAWIILDEFEKWYMVGDRVLRVAKVVVWQE